MYVKGQAAMTTASIAAAALAFLPLAHADDVSFLKNVQRFGIANVDGDGALLDVGRGICSDLFNGQAGETVAAKLYYNSAYGQEDGPRYAIDLTLARTMVVYAITDLCPGAKAIPGAIPK